MPEHNRCPRLFDVLPFYILNVRDMLDDPAHVLSFPIEALATCRHSAGVLVHDVEIDVRVLRQEVDACQPMHVGTRCRTQTSSRRTRVTWCLSK